MTGSFSSSGAAYRLAEEEQRRGHMTVNRVGMQPMEGPNAALTPTIKIQSACWLTDPRAPRCQLAAVKMTERRQKSGKGGGRYTPRREGQMRRILNPREGRIITSTSRLEVWRAQRYFSPTEGPDSRRPHASLSALLGWTLSVPSRMATDGFAGDARGREEPGSAHTCR